MLQKLYGPHKTMFIQKNFAVITASISEIEEFSHANPGVIKYHTPMLPEMKIDAKLVPLSKHSGMDCAEVVKPFNGEYSTRGYKPSEQKTQKLALRVMLAPLTHQEIEEFTSFLNTRSRDTTHGERPFTYFYDKAQRVGQKHYVEITLSGCEHTMTVATALAERREVMWVERLHVAYSHNRWSRGVCDTGDWSSAPLDTNSAANLTGSGHVIGVIDTGIDMKNCYFRDDDQPVPYVKADVATSSTPNYSARKVIQYYTHTVGSRSSDTIDDSGGHGTHVAGSKFPLLSLSLYIFKTIYFLLQSETVSSTKGFVHKFYCYIYFP
jgi:hypothetical protein